MSNQATIRAVIGFIEKVIATPAASQNEPTALKAIHKVIGLIEKQAGRNLEVMRVLRDVKQALSLSSRR